MVSIPSAYRISASGENTGARSGSALRAAPQSGLSRSASSAIVDQTSSVVELANGLDGAVDLLVAVGERGEQALELRRRDVDPTREQVPEAGGVALGVAALGVVEGADRGARREEREHRADALDDAVGREAVGQAGSAALELLVDPRLPKPAEHREAGRGRKRIPGESPGLVDGAHRRELVHQLGAAAEGGERQAPAHDLAQDGEIRQDAEPLLRAASGDAEAGDHLVEDEQRPGGVAEAAEQLEEARIRRHDAHVPGDRLDDDRREPFAVAGDGIRGLLEVVVWANDRVLRHGWRN